jgi:hypothetical protein
MWHSNLLGVRKLSIDFTLCVGSVAHEWSDFSQSDWTLFKVEHIVVY